MRRFLLPILTIALLMTAGCPRRIAEEPAGETETVEPGPPVGLDVSPAQPQNERPGNP